MVNAILKIDDWEGSCRVLMSENKIDTSIWSRSEDDPLFKMLGDLYQENVVKPAHKEIKLIIEDEELVFPKAYLSKIVFGDYSDETDELEIILEWYK